MERLTDQSSINKLRKSFYNVFAYFLNEEADKEIMTCLFKWGLQLNIYKIELLRIQAIPALLSFEKPACAGDALEQIYDLVYITYMDGIVEDVELQLINSYVKAIGMEPHIVNNILKALVSATYDGIGDQELRKDILRHPEVYV